MNNLVPIRLVPLGVELQVARGARLEDVLFPYGVEFPCGGAGLCRGCRIRVLEGQLSITPEMEQAFTAEELAQGWRLACCSVADTALSLEVAQWETPVLSDESPLEFTPSEGLGIAIDLGTTTLVAQLVDLCSGQVLAVETGINPQCLHGADVMSRIEFGLAEKGGAKLRGLVREALGRMCAALAEGREIRAVLVAGNTAMHHLFCGLPLAPLARAPFDSPHLDEQSFASSALDWDLPADPPVRFLPCPGGFVGSDILAGVLACGLDQSPHMAALIDLGTNGEIVVGNRDGLLVASTAAGPAFEGGQIRMGMRAAAGAITHAALCSTAGKPRLECQVLGGGEPRGICGSGLVDVVAAALDAGWILPRGRFADGSKELPICPPVRLWQSDVRELLLAKAAVAAGLRILLKQAGAAADSLSTLYIAGAFGNYIRFESARRIGLLEAGVGKLQAAGNTSLRGTRMLLLNGDRGREALARVRRLMRHVPLAQSPDFMDTFVDCMVFPA